MKFQKTPLALAASALLSSAPFAAHALSGAFVQPTSEQTVSGVLQGSACEVRGSDITSVNFYWDYAFIGTDKAGPFQCPAIDTTKFPNGKHRVRAVFFDSKGNNNATSVYVNVQNGTTTTPTTNTPPTISISAPASGATVKGTVSCAASASDSNGIQNVAFSLDGAPLSTDSTSPYACSFDSTKLANGTHKLTAVASDALGATTTREVSFTVDNTVATNPGPTITWTAPANGAKLSNQAACATTVSDSDGVAQVQYFMNDKLWRTEKVAPYTCEFWTKNYADGAYVLKAVATDTKGATSTAQLNVTIANNATTPPPNTPPTLSISAPASGATVKGTVSCAASASDSNGIQNVAFSLDGAPLSTDSTSPYACSFDSTKLANGTHKLTAVASDALGATTTREVSFTVDNTVATNPGPTITWTAPANGAKLSNQAACATTVSDSDGVAQVQYFMNDKLWRTEKVAPYTCEFWTKNYADGAYVLKAVATDTKGATSTAQINVTIANNATTPPADTTPPTVSIMSPSSGAKVVPNTPYTADAKDNTAVAKVEVFLASGTTQKLVDTKTAAPYSGTLNTTGLPNGSATLMAVATDTAGLSSTTQRSVTIDNTVSNPDPTDPGPGTGGGTTLPATNAKAVPTFESLGMYWKPGSNPGADGCNVRYRKADETAWKQGFPMWYDARNAECRGSIVHLQPGTDYAVEMGVGGSFQAGVNVKTWSESLPIAKTVKVESGSNTLAITEGGTKDGYVVYEGPATIDVANAKDFAVTIAAPYVIVRGLTVKGAKRNGIHLLAGAHDVVIEDNDISGWGRLRTTLSNGWKVGVDADSAVYAHCRDIGYMIERVVVQRNKLHDPRYTTNSWDFGHPAGPQAITFKHCGGNHVLRYNDVYSADGTKYLNDGFSGGENFSDIGFPHADTDIYGNRISHVWDDAIEAEGGNRNVRIWGNYLDQTATGIATTVTNSGPVYIFRNVYNRSRMKSQKALDSDDRSNFAKSGTQSGYGGGRRYVLHNTLLQAVQSGVTYPLGAGGGIIAAGTTSPVTNTMSRNNILHVWKPHWDAIRVQTGATANDFDYDLRNGGISAYAGAEASGWVGTPIYKSGHGWQSWGEGNYQLESNSPGYDKGQRLPNFNDAFTGAGPDVGAHEAGTPPMRLGTGGSSAQWAAPSGTDTSTTSSGSTSTTGSTGGTTASSGEVCSTALCVLTQ